jgi:hypothetical protein
LGPVLYHWTMRTPMPQRMPERIVELFWEANGPRHSVRH